MVGQTVKIITRKSNPKTNSWPILLNWPSILLENRFLWPDHFYMHMHAFTYLLRGGSRVFVEEGRGFDLCLSGLCVPLAN